MQAWHRIIIYIDEIVICTQVIMKKYHLQMAFTKNFKIIYIIKLSTTELFGINSQMPDEFAG